MSATATAPATEQVQIVTQEDLLKTMNELSGKAPEPAKEVVPEAETVTLTSTLEKTIGERGAETLKKALDVSPVLKDLAGTMGVHVDTVLQTFGKHINDQAKVNMAIVGAFSELKKSIDANTEAIKAMGAAPGAPAAAAGTEVVATEVLTKTADKQTKIDPKAAKEQIVLGLETLVKSMKPGDNKAAQYQAALIKFDSTGQISDAMLAEALKATK